MAISITEILGTDSISGSRLTINNNFTIIEDEINLIETVFNSSTKAIDNSGSSTGSLTTRSLTTTTGGVTLQQGDLTISVGNETITAGNLTVTAGNIIGSDATKKIQIAGDSIVGKRSINSSSPQTFTSAGTISTSGVPYVLTDSATALYQLSLPDVTVSGVTAPITSFTIIHLGVGTFNVEIVPSSFGYSSNTKIVLIPGANVTATFINSKWYVTAGKGYTIV